MSVFCFFAKVNLFNCEIDIILKINHQNAKITHDQEERMLTGDNLKVVWAEFSI